MEPSKGMSQTSKRVLTLLGGIALFGGGVLLATLYSKPAKAQTSPGTTPVWTKLQADPRTGIVSIPANATVALSNPSTDPSADFIGTGSSQAFTATQEYKPGTPPPASFPEDGLGLQAFRATGVNSSAVAQDIQTTQSTRVWIITGWQ